jgi:hypothetical protein
MIIWALEVQTKRFELRSKDSLTELINFRHRNRNWGQSTDIANI